MPLYGPSSGSPFRCFHMGKSDWTGPRRRVFMRPCCACVPACLASSNLACPAQLLTRRLATAGFTKSSWMVFACWRDVMAPACDF
jgi:hypothetical protein